MTAVLTRATGALVDRRTFGLDIVTAAGYVVNWGLAARSVDYLAEGTGVSPVQHYWSLAVEEQFYVLWPLLMLAAAWWWRRRPRGGPRLRSALTVAILLVTVPSLAWSVHLTATDPTTAFFVTPTRLWGQGIGALLALGPARLLAWRPAVVVGGLSYSLYL